MNKQTNKTQEEDKQLAINQAQQQNKNEATTFEDNSPEALEAAQIQELADNSPETKEAAELQNLADNSPEVLEAAQMQELADNSELVEATTEPEKVLEESPLDNGLPTPKELSDRFGDSFQDIAARFQEQIELEVTSAMTAVDVPKELDHLNEKLLYMIESSALSTQLQLEDTETDPTKKEELVMAYIELKVVDTIKDADFRDHTLVSNMEKNIVDKSELRDLYREGTVSNPGMNEDWIYVNVRDEKNDRNLEIKLRIHFQIPTTE